MADSKVSELTAATSTSGSDLLYLVQSNTSKKISVANFFSSAKNANLSGNVRITGRESVTTGGYIDVNVPITLLSEGGTFSPLEIPNGQEGQIKLICFESSTGGTFQLNTGNIAGDPDIFFEKEGQSAILLYSNSQWHVLGGTANVIYP